jgi:hypothetical protein
LGYVHHITTLGNVWKIETLGYVHHTATWGYDDHIATLGNVCHMGCCNVTNIIKSGQVVATFNNVVVINII